MSEPYRVRITWTKDMTLDELKYAFEEHKRHFVYLFVTSDGEVVYVGQVFDE